MKVNKKFLLLKICLKFTKLVKLVLELKKAEKRLKVLTNILKEYPE